VSGLDRALSAGLERWRAPRAVHAPAKVLLDLAVTLALGGGCLADVAVLRAEPGVYGRVASDPTVSRAIEALAADAPRALLAINRARAAARAAVWQLAGQHAPDHEVSAEQPLVVDIDATLVTPHSDKEQSRPTLKRGYRRGTDLAVERDAGIRPLSVSADRIAAVAVRGAGLLGTIASLGEPVAARAGIVWSRRTRQRPCRAQGRREGLGARRPGRWVAGRAAGAASRRGGRRRAEVGRRARRDGARARGARGRAGRHRRAV